MSAAACTTSVTQHSGDSEPLLNVRYPLVTIAGAGTGSPSAQAQFFEGPFPSDSGGPEVPNQLSAKDTELPAGVANQAITGIAASPAQSVAVGFQNIGHGYWVAPVGTRAAEMGGNFVNWEVDCDFSRDIPPGTQPLIFAASGADGHFGKSQALSLTFDSPIPKGHVVASLTWGNNADLDLHLVSPSGVELDPKNLNTVGVVDAGPDAGMQLPGNGRLDRDSNANCFADGFRTENVVWSDAPEAGTYLVRVDMFNACGTPAASFKFTLYVDGLPVMVQGGQLLDIDADGGGPGSGLYIGLFTCDGSGTCS
ncbi:MAG TPA: hypothetical protein VGI10_03320 [Polyangiaceae bacterium]|jgi:hypothetical protein